MRIPLITLSGAVVLSAAVMASTGQDVDRTDQSAADPDGFGGASVPVPYVVRDINPNGSSEPVAFVRFRGATYFTANDGEHGFELWRTDGTARGTVLIRDINPGGLNGAPLEMTEFRGQLYFAANTAEAGRELWATDGTPSGTRLVSDMNPGAADGNPVTFSRFRDALVFRAQDAAGMELWSTRGTADSTRLITDLHPGPEGSIPTYPTEYRGEIFFSADDVFTPGFGFDRELWKTDGTEAGTVRVKDINPGPGTAIPGELTRLGRDLIFKAQEPTYGPELWRTDGTEAGTTILADINPGPAPGFPSNLVRVGREIFFIAEDEMTGRELWKTDGTPEGTVLVKDINPGPGSSQPLGVAFRGGLLFNANDGEHGGELWFSDGTEAGTRLVKDLNPGPELSSPLDIVVSGREAWFVTVRQSEQGDGSVETTLWRTDGSTEGTQLVWQAPGRSSGYAIEGLTISGRHLFFSAPTTADENGIGTDIELHAIRLRHDDWWDRESSQ